MLSRLLGRLTVRITVFVAIATVSALIRGGNILLREVNDFWKEAQGQPTAQAQFVAQPTFIALVVAMQEAQAPVASVTKALHPPQAFKSYHDEIVQSLAAAEGALVTLMHMADGGPGLTQAEQGAMTQAFKEAESALNTYPRIASGTSSSNALATLRASILESRSGASLRFSSSTPEPPGKP